MASGHSKTVARMGLACVAAALVSGVLNGLWEMTRPVMTPEEMFASASAAQRWGFGLMALIKSAGFFAGLWGFYLAATRRGRVLKVFMALAAAGAFVFTAVWLWMAATGRFTLAYVLGGMWYQMVGPVALGVGALPARRVARWKGAWAIAVGVINSQLFAWLGPGPAQVVQGVIWMILGYVVYTSRAAADG